MNYEMHYQKLISRAKNRVLDGYVESHHIKPKCMGGLDETDNLVQLTPEEHFVAHQLLHKMHPEVKGLAFALMSMTGNPYGHRANKFYGWIRRKVAIAQSLESTKRWADPNYREKHKAAMDAVRANPEYKNILSKAFKGRKKSDQERANIAAARRRAQPRKFSEEAKANMAAARKKTWEERRAKGEHLIIAQKTRETRIKNGSYVFSETHKENIGKASKIAWNKRKSEG